MSESSILNRREFIQAGLTAGAGAMLAQTRSVRAQKPASEELNLAVIGAGAQGRVLINAMLNIPKLKFRAVCDIWEYSRQYGQRYLMKYGHKPNAYEDYREMLEKEKGLDAVIVASPDFMHAEMTNAALQSGIHVYCEKCMSNDIEKARSMVKTMKQTGKLLQIGHQRRSNPRYLHVYNNLIKKAKIPGRLTNASAQWNRAVSEDIGWPEKYTIPPETLKKYGYENMAQFRNWRWFKKYGGGPISDLGAHQIDIFNWFFDVSPTSVLAGGGVDYYKTHEWYDNVMAIFEYKTPEGTARAFYQVLTTTSAGGGYFENFMGENATIKLSENPKFTKIYRETRAPDWQQWVSLNYLVASQAPAAAKPAEGAAVDVRETAEAATFDIPVVLEKPYHQPHLENFFDAIRGKAKLTCPADEAFKSEVAVLKVNDAVAAKQMLVFKPEDFAI